jgi:hypothetical protein
MYAVKRSLKEIVRSIYSISTVVRVKCDTLVECDTYTKRSFNITVYEAFQPPSDFMAEYRQEDIVLSIYICIPFLAYFSIRYRPHISPPTLYTPRHRLSIASRSNGRALAIC